MKRGFILAHVNVQARIEYLRKEKKDDLIAKMLSLQARGKIRAEEAMRLREEILTLMQPLIGGC